MKICAMDQGHMTKMATMPIYIVEKVIFIVASSCADNLQSLKEIHAWADLDPPTPFYLNTLFTQRPPLVRIEILKILFSGLKGR